MRSACLALIVLACLVPAAEAGRAVKHRPDCPDMYAHYLGKADRARFRSGVLCLMSALRKEFHLNALTRDARLETAGQGWANHLARTGRANHGKSYAEIPKRIARAGYRAQAVNEGLGIGLADETPYSLMRSMMTDFACTEILDPRFRDAGVGVSVGRLAGYPGPGIHVVAEFGLKASAKVPSHDNRPARTCSHRLPAPPATVLAPTRQPTVGDTDVTVTVKCVARQACEGDAVLELAKRGKRATAPVPSLAPGATTDLDFAFPAADIAAERKAKGGGVNLLLRTSRPVAFEDLFSTAIG